MGFFLKCVLICLYMQMQIILFFISTCLHGVQVSISQVSPSRSLGASGWFCPTYHFS